MSNNGLLAYLPGLWADAEFFDPASGLRLDCWGYALTGQLCLGE